MLLFFNFNMENIMNTYRKSEYLNLKSDALSYELIRFDPKVQSRAEHQDLCNRISDFFLNEVSPYHYDKQKEDFVFDKAQDLVLTCGESLDHLFGLEY